MAYAIEYGSPGWQETFLAGNPVAIYYSVGFDKDSETFWAKGSNIFGVNAEGITYDEVHKEFRLAALSIIELELESFANELVEKFDPLNNERYRFMYTNESKESGYAHLGFVALPA